MTVSCEKSCFDKIKNLLKTEDFKIGLVIGQSLKESDFIIHVAELVTVGNAEEVKPTCLKDVQCKHISNHIGQVIRMLPGGLDVQGIFVIGNDPSSTANKAIIGTFLKTIHEATSRYYLNPEDCPARKLFLYGCKKTNRIGAKGYCVTDTNGDYTHRDVKSDRINWLEINYKYSVERASYLPQGSDAQSLVKDEKALLEPLKSFLSTGIILINGKIRNDADRLDERASFKGSSKQSSNDYAMVPPKYITAEFLENRDIDIPNATIEESLGYIYTSGCVAGRAYLHNQATILEAKTALRTDLMRSLVSRWQMHCDSLIEEPPEGTSGPVVHEPPRRVFLEGGGLPVSLCDYLFPGDSVLDACQSAFELLGISVSEENVDDTIETFPDADELLASRDPSDDEQASTVISIDTVKRSNSLQIFIAIFVCLVATALSYVFFTREKFVRE